MRHAAAGGATPVATPQGRPIAVRQGAARSAALALLVGVAAAPGGRAAADDELPTCTFEACPVCFPGAKTSLANLTIFGPDNQYHQVPLRVAKCPAFWDAQSIPAQIAGFLLTEMLGIAVDYVPVWDETSIWLAVNGCIGFTSYNCRTWEVRGDEALKDKFFPDVLSDVMFSPSFAVWLISRQTTRNTDLDFDSRPSVNLGPAGFTITQGLFVPQAIVKKAAKDGLELRWFLSLEADRARSYFDVPQRLIDDGIVALRQGCSSNYTIVQNGMDTLTAMGFQCRDSWWLTPACAAEFGDRWATECMVMIDDDWGFWKPTVYAAMAQSKAPIAKLTVGYGRWFQLATSGTYNAITDWFLPDASLAKIAPQYMRMPWEIESKATIYVKTAYGPALEADPKVKAFLTAFTTETPVIEGLMKSAAAAYISGREIGDGVFRKVACDWLRANQDIWREWMPSAKSCLPGQVFDEDSQHCVPCRRGTYAPAHRAVCSSCPPGTFTQVEGALECSACIPGQFSSVTGASTGEVCQRCPQGTFAALPGRSACQACNDTFTTLFPGAIFNSDCTCAVDSYLRLPVDGNVQEARCASCAKGLLCPGGAERPLQAPGFAASAFTVGGPTRIVACSSSVKCPGGTPLGTCPEHREGIACEVCADGYFEQEGRCAACHGRNPALSIVPLLVIALIGVALLSRAARHRVGVRASSVVTLMLTCSLTISTLQMATSFEKLLSNWPEPLASIYYGLRFFTIDLNVLGLACVFRLGRPEVAYLGSLLLHPAFAFALLLGVWSLRLFGWRIPVDEVINIQGLVVSAVYIALTIVSLRPWQCNANPDGTSSVASSRGVICWSSPEHGLMIGLSLVALSVYVVGAFAVVGWATWVYPRKIHSSEGEHYIRRFRFLYFRFNAQHYAFVIPFMVRSVLVSVLPVVLVNEPAICVMLLVLVVGSGCAVQCWIRPWREVWINYLDAMVSLSIQLILTGATTIMVGDQHHMERMVMYFYMALIFSLGGCLLTVGLISLWKWSFPSLCYGIFLCHHKDGAGVLARWFKMLLSELTSERIFLDSDELDRLDKIFEIVARETKYVTVILTEHTMKRIWCAGEMATAVRYKIGTVVVACGDYQPMSDEFIADVARMWTEEQLNQAFALGVSVRDIQEGYRAIRDMPALLLDRESPQAAHEHIVLQLFRSCPNLCATGVGQMRRLRSHVLGEQADVAPRNSWGSNQTKDGAHAYIVVAGDMEDPEAATACAVIARLLAREMAAVVRVLQRTETSLAEHTGTRFLLAALSRNVLRNAAFAALLVDAERNSLECVPVIADTHFRVPESTFWQARADRSTDDWPDVKKLARHQTGIDEVASSYRRLFNVLAMRFSTSGSARIQAAEVKELVPRFCRAEGADRFRATPPPEGFRATPPPEAGTPRREMSPVDEPEPKDHVHGPPAGLQAAQVGGQSSDGEEEGGGQAEEEEEEAMGEAGSSPSGGPLRPDADPATPRRAGRLHAAPAKRRKRLCSL